MMKKILDQLGELSAQVSGRLHYMEFRAIHPESVGDPETGTMKTQYREWIRGQACRLEFRRVMRSGVDRREPISESVQQVILYHNSPYPLPIGTILQITNTNDGTEYGYFQVKGESAQYVSHTTTPLERLERFPKHV